MSEANRFGSWRQHCNEDSTSRLAADGASNSFAIWTLIAYAILKVETNVPGRAYLYSAFEAPPVSRP